MRQEECPSLEWKFIEDKEREKNFKFYFIFSVSETEIYMLFLQSRLMICEETIKILEENAPMAIKSRTAV